MRKIIAAILALGLFLSSCSGAGDPSDTESTVPDNNDTAVLESISIPYIENDSFNPYTAYSSINIAALPLIYDSLVTVDNNFEAENLIAEKIERTSSTTLTVTIKDNVYFSNGNKLTASDVVFSFNSCKQNGSYFPEKLSEITSATAAGDKTVVFNLREASRYAENCLDFPITEKASGTENPIGSGRYVLSYSDKTPLLKANKNHFATKDFTFETVNFVSIPDNDSLFLAIKTGSVNIIPSDLSLGTYVGTFCKTESVPTSNLVFIGVSSTGLAAEKQIRQYISAALDRSVIVSVGNLLSSVETSLPLFPKKEEIFSSSLNSAAKNSAKITELRSAPEFTFKDEGKLHFRDEKVTLRILYSEDSSEKKAFAQTISAQLSAVGIETELVGKSYADYKASIASSDFDLYIGETKLSGSLNLSGLLSSSEFGLSASPELMTAYTAFNSFEAEPKSFLDMFSDELPFIPIMYKSGSIAYSKTISTKVETSVSDCYKSIQYLK